MIEKPADKILLLENRRLITGEAPLDTTGFVMVNAKTTKPVNPNQNSHQTNGSSNLNNSSSTNDINHSQNGETSGIVEIPAQTKYQPFFSPPMEQIEEHFISPREQLEAIEQQTKNAAQNLDPLLTTFQICERSFDLLHTRNMLVQALVRWVNYILRHKRVNLEKLTDLKDGVLFVQIIEELTATTFPYQYNKQPHSLDERIHNIQFVLKHIQKSIGRPIELLVTAQSVSAGTLLSVATLLWIIVYVLRISKFRHKKSSGIEAIIHWIQDKTESYDYVQIQDMCLSFQDGLAFCAIFHSCDHQALDYDKIQPVLPPFFSHMFFFS